MGVWTPQPGPQAEAIVATWCTELFFGGARGGGKSDFLLGDYLQDVQRYGKHWSGIIFRRTYPELQELIKRSHALYSQTGAVWREADKEWHWPNGASFKLRYLEAVRDASRYQGHEYQWVGWDELTQWSSDEAYRMLLACLRCSQADVPTKRVRSSGNPGGPGHAWVKTRFVGHSPLGFEPITDSETKLVRMYLPARVSDNRILLERDPTYIDRLKGVGSQELVRAWLEGDWNVVQGAYFSEFSEQHIIQPVKIANHLLKFRSLDWGSMRPFSVGWYAVSDGSIGSIPSGALIKYREWYGGSAPNVGLKLRVEEVAAGIKLRQSPDEEFAYSVADPAIFSEDGGPSIAETFRKSGVVFRPGDNKRLPGWQQVRSRLVGLDGKPMLYLFSTCRDTIRTLPALQHDDARPEDINTEGDDHAADELRYACMSRPYMKSAPVFEPIRSIHEATLDELWEKIPKYQNKVRV